MQTTPQARHWLEQVQESSKTSQLESIEATIEPDARSNIGVCCDSECAIAEVAKDLGKRRHRVGYAIELEAYGSSGLFVLCASIVGHDTQVNSVPQGMQITGSDTSVKP